MSALSRSVLTAFVPIVGLVWSTREAHAFTPAEVERGRTVFSKCIPCHSIEGYPKPEGSFWELSGPLARRRLVAASETPGHEGSVADLADFIQVRMPLNRPGTLKEVESREVVAFILYSNGIATDEKEGTRETLGATSTEALLTPTRRLIRRSLYGVTSVGLLALLATQIRKRRRK